MLFKKTMNHIDWNDIEVLESIANQCIYKGKEVGQARAALKAIYGCTVSYDDEINEDDCNIQTENNIKRGLF